MSGKKQTPWLVRRGKTTPENCSHAEIGLVYIYKLNFYKSDKCVIQGDRLKLAKSERSLPFAFKLYFETIQRGGGGNSRMLFFVPSKGAFLYRTCCFGLMLKNPLPAKALEILSFFHSQG